MTSLTVVVLTLNEEANIGRCLASVAWADRVVVVDSGSTDQTEAIARSHSNVAWYQRRFDDHGSQWGFGLEEGAATGEFLLTLDADMAVTATLKDELGAVLEKGSCAGGVIGFDYRIDGVPLRESLCRPQLRLLRRGLFSVELDGHTQAFRAAGPVHRFKARLIHDDRKPIERFVGSQLRYSALEARRLQEDAGGWALKNWIRRRLSCAPVAAWLLAYLRAGGPIGGAAASRYAAERLLFEGMLRYRLDSAAIEAGKGRRDE